MVGTTHRTTLIAAAVLAMFTVPAFAQTPPPAATVTVCRADSAGVLQPITLHADQAQPGDRVTATGSCAQPTVSVAGEQATPTPAEPTVTPTAQPTLVPTAEPTVTAEPTWTPEPWNPEPWPTGTIGPSK